MCSETILQNIDFINVKATKNNYNFGTLLKAKCLITIKRFYFKLQQSGSSAVKFSQDFNRAFFSTYQR